MTPGLRLSHALWSTTHMWVQMIILLAFAAICWMKISYFKICVRSYLNGQKLTLLFAKKKKKKREREGKQGRNPTGKSISTNPRIFGEKERSPQKTAAPGVCSVVNWENLRPMCAFAQPTPSMVALGFPPAHLPCEHRRWTASQRHAPAAQCRSGCCLEQTAPLLL